MRVDELPLWFLRTLVIFFGLIWGSFLNVVIYRVPLEMSVATPPSHCPACGKPVRAFDNVPVLSFLILRGRARCCGAKMGVRYPLVELIGGVLSLAIFEVIVRALPGETMAYRAAAIYLADFAVALALVAAAFIDAEHMFLPDAITIGGTVLGIATATLRGVGLGESVMGALGGYLVIWLLFIVVYKAIRGTAGMGLGDAKLLMLAGAWFGWPGAAFVLFAGATQGSLGTLLILLLRGKIEDPEAIKAERAELERLAAEGDPEDMAEAKQILAEDPVHDGSGRARIPFGPFLILAFLEYLLAAPQLGAWFTQFL